MTQQHRTTRYVYRAAVAHLADSGDSSWPPDETWPGDPDVLPLTDMHDHDEVIASVDVTVHLADELDSVEQVRADGSARLIFPQVEGIGQALSLYPGDLPVIRAALAAIESEWRRLGVYATPERAS